MRIRTSTAKSHPIIVPFEFGELREKRKGRRPLRDERNGGARHAVLERRSNFTH
jgi:hypothetical protein